MKKHPVLCACAAAEQEKRIYDRILEVCMPIRFEGENFRKTAASENLRKAAEIMGK